MSTEKKTAITVETVVNAPVEKVWENWNSPDAIVKWNSAHPDWHTPWATNDLRVGGQILSRMEARDGSMGFDFGGTYDEVELHKSIAYTMGDDRRVRVTFTPEGNATRVTETFDAEDQNPHELQRGGWQAILDNFRKYTEQS
jgi:uncharacterized protein YndB with AHSA1/START domain